MEFGFKETKMGYAKAEVDSYILKLQNQIDDLQFRSINLEKEHYAVSIRTMEIKKTAVLKSKKIIDEASEVVFDINAEVYKGFEGVGKIATLLNNVVQSKVQPVPDDEIFSLFKDIDDLQEELSTQIKELCM